MIDDWAWIVDAACLHPPRPMRGTFFDGDAEAEAKQVCGSCPVLTECGDYADRNDIRFGVWGGRTPRERGVEG